MLRICIAVAILQRALTTPLRPARHVVPLHRQRVPVQGEDDRISYKSVYFGSVTVGAPEQKFAVVFDTGSGHVIIPSSECHSETCRIHNRYSREASPAAMDIDYDGSPVQPGTPRDQITVAFGTGEVTGQFVKDRLCLGALGAAKLAAPPAAVPSYTEPLLLVQSGEAELARTPTKGQANVSGNASNEMPRSQALNCVDLRVVMATEMTEEPFHAFSFDGVLGLGLDSLALAPEFSFFGMMGKQVALEHRSFGVFLADTDSEVSEISFGGSSEDKVASAMTWAPVALPDLGYWQVEIKAIRIGDRTLDYCADGQCRAVVDTGTSLLAVPDDFAEGLQEALERRLEDPEQGPDGGVDCQHARGEPLHFDVEGTTLTLLPGDYSRQAVHADDEPPESSSDTPAQDEPRSLPAEKAEGSSANATRPTCQPTIMPLELPEPLGPKLFIWGEPVLRKYYTVYDWQAQQIGFALAKHMPSEVSAAEEAKQLRGRGLLFA